MLLDWEGSRRAQIVVRLLGQEEEKRLGVEFVPLLRDHRPEETGVRQLGHIDPLCSIDADGLPDLLVLRQESLTFIANTVEEIVPRAPAHFDRR